MKRRSSLLPCVETTNSGQVLKGKRQKVDGAPDSIAICEMCHSITSSHAGLQSLASNTGYAHYTKSETRASANDGCIMCVTIYEGARKIWTLSERLIFFATFSGRPCFQTASQNEVSSLLRFDSISGYGKNRRCIITLTAMTASSSQYIAGRVPVSQVAAISTTNHAKSWIDECLNNHEACPSPRASLLPTRVIDLEAKSNEGASCLHISTKNETAEYATLSYCWGEAQKYCLLTTAVLEAWKRRLPVEDLPRLLQDAIEITLGLGIRYLWVDALCILQDDISDKTKEIERMGKIYMNSRVTIAAATARGVSDGFISTREPLRCTTLPFLCPDGTTGGISFAKNIWAYRPEQPLDSRGWALQEYLLSPRLLMYGATELTWHCQTQVFKSIGKSHLVYWPLAQRLPSQLFDCGGPRPRSSPRQRHELWASIATDYSGRLLTFPEDKLVAIAGVAKELSELWKDSYLYGCWHTILIHCLGWKRDPRAMYNVERSSQAPSWSWLSMNCRIDFWPDVHRVDAAVLKHHSSMTKAPMIPSCHETTRIALRAKMLSAQELRAGDIYGWSITWDLTHEHSTEDAVYYLLLGFSKRKHPLSLVLTLLDDNMFHRAGFANYCYTDRWGLCTPTTVELLSSATELCRDKKSRGRSEPSRLSSDSSYALIKVVNNLASLRVATLHNLGIAKCR